MKLKTKFGRTLLLSGLLILQILSGYPIRSFGFDDSGYSLDDTEVLEIALSNPEISDWLLTHSLLDTEVREYWVNYPTDKLWTVTLTTSSSEETILVKITISDYTRKVIGISYMDKLSENDTEIQIQQQAIDFFMTQSISSFFTLYNYSMEAGVQRANIVTIYGRNGTSNQNRRNFQAQIAYNSSNSGDHTFSMIKITSETEFGEIGIGTQELISHINNNSIVSNFTTQYPGYYQGISAVLYYESNYHDRLPGYTYEVTLESQNYFYLEYINEDYQITYDNGFDPRAVHNIILTRSDYLSLEVNHTTGEILSLDGTFIRIHEITKLIDIVFEKSENIPWIEKIFRFEAELIYNLNGIYSLTIKSVISSDMGSFIINDTSGMTLTQTIIHSRDALRSSQEILSHALSNQEIIEFFDNNEIVNHTILFDTIDTWIVDFYNPILSQNTARIQINDTSGDIIVVKINMLDPQPILQNVGIIDRVFATDYWKHYFVFGDSRLAYYYNINGYWSAYLYSQLFPENYYRILIDDQTGEIIGETNNAIGTGNQTSDNELRSKLNEVIEISDFKEIHPDAYEAVYFNNGWIYYSEALTSQLLLDTIKIRFDSDLEVSSVEDHQYVLGSDFINEGAFVSHDEYYSFENYPRINTNKVTGIAHAYELEILNRIFSFSVSELLGGELVYFTPDLKKNEDENSLDSYILIATFGILVTIFVFIRLKRKK